MVKIIKLSAIDSTNTYLKELCKNVKLDDGTIVVTRRQTAGRGQMGAKWQSVEGLSLAFSVFKRFSSVLLIEQSQINFAVSLGIMKALQKLQVPDIRIKWPNDIMSYQKKLCGVLIENQLDGDKITSSVIGIGLNVNESEFPNLPFASSMKLSSGTSYNLDEVLHLVSEAIMKELAAIDTSKTLVSIREKYESNLFRKDKVSVFENTEGNNFNGIIRGVTESGKLLVELEDESIQDFELKQIRMLL